MAEVERSEAADTVARGCMAEKGYLFVPAEDAERKSAELADIAAQKRQQEALPTPPAKQKK